MNHNAVRASFHINIYSFAFMTRAAGGVVITFCLKSSKSNYQAYVNVDDNPKSAYRNFIIIIEDAA